MEAAIRKKDRMQITKYFKSGNFLREKLQNVTVTIQEASLSTRRDKQNYKGCQFL